MEGIARTPKFILLYRLAKGGDESQSRHFFYNYLITKFMRGEQTDDYTIASLSHPDRGQRTVEYMISKYNSDSRRLDPLFVYAAKAIDDSPTTVEEQGLDSARRVCETHNLERVMVLTTFDTGFRLWYFADGKLNAWLHGDAERGDRHQYIDANEPKAVLLDIAVEAIRGNLSMKEAQERAENLTVMDATQRSMDHQQTGG